MNKELYKFHERNFDFKNKFPQFGSVFKVLNNLWLNVKPYKPQVSKKYHFDKRYLKVIPIERSHAA